MPLEYDMIEAQLQRLTGGVAEFDCDSQTRRLISEAIADEVNKHVPRMHFEVDHSALAELAVNGIVKIKQGIEQDKLAEIVSHFENIPVFSGHVPAQSDGIRRYLEKGAKQFPFGSYVLEDVLQCPHLLEVALRPDIVSLAAAYLGCTPTIYSMNAWWSFPAFSPAMTQDYHRDVDDFKFLALFIYLTDVKAADDGGQHQFIIGTQDEEQVVKLLDGDKEKASSLFMPKLRKLGYRQSNVYKSLFADQIIDVTGSAGSIFLADTYGLHRGVPPKRASRLVCWTRYGLRRNLAYKNDKTMPVPRELLDKRIGIGPQTRYMLRLLAIGGQENGFDAANYKVLTEQGLYKARVADYDWENVTLSPLENEVEAPTKSFIKDKASRMKSKFLRLLSYR